jgi:phospholipase C
MRRVAAGLATLIALAACAPHAAVAPPAALRTNASLSGSEGHRATPIDHVVIVLQENRSFDDLFQGYPGADTVSSGLNSQGQRVALQPIPLTEAFDMDNSAQAFLTAYDGGKMDGFDREAVYYRHKRYQNPQYGYVPHGQSKPYFDMARQYVLADRMFTSQLDGSFISHQYIIAGYASRGVNFPSGPWHCGGGSGDTVPTLTQHRKLGPAIRACMNNATLGDELDEAGLSWRFYAGELGSVGGLWNAYGAVRHVRYGPDWKKVISPPSQFVTDVAAGTLANVTWITPTWQDSDHPESLSNTGPSWVTSVVNAVGGSRFWNTTAVFLMWDDWGGWYDHVPPPQLDYDGLGIRVPLLVISAYAKRGYVTHVQYEHGSVLRFVEDNWGLAQLAASDARANDPATDAFDWSQPPRTFTPFSAQGSSS